MFTWLAWPAGSQGMPAGVEGCGKAVRELRKFRGEHDTVEMEQGDESLLNSGRLNKSWK